MVHITTPRLVLRDFTQLDFNALHGIGSDTEVTRYTSFGPNTPEETKAFLAFAVAQSTHSDRSEFDLAIQLRDSDEMIGSCGFGAENHGQYEIGYVLAKPYWHHGFATEVVVALLRFAFEQLRAQKVWAPVDANNLASCRVLEKAGFRQEGRLRQDRLKWPEGRDTKLFGLLAEEWNRTGGDVQ